MLRGEEEEEAFYIIQNKVKTKATAPYTDSWNVEDKVKTMDDKATAPYRDSWMVTTFNHLIRHFFEGDAGNTQIYQRLGRKTLCMIVWKSLLTGGKHIVF